LTIAPIFGGGRASVDAANAQNQTRTASQSLADVRAGAEAVHAAVLQVIAGLAPEEWQAEVVFRGSTREPLAELVSGILGDRDRPFGHTWAHLPGLRAYVTSLGR
jgi:hypothetical protein